MGVDAIVLGLAAVDGFHVQRVAEHEGDPLAGAEIGEPVPGEDAFHRDDQVLTVGLDGPQEDPRIAANVLVKEDLPSLVENAQIHGSGVQVDAAVVLVLPGVESHRFPSCEWVGFAAPAYPTSGRHRRGP